MPLYHSTKISLFSQIYLGFYNASISVAPKNFLGKINNNNKILTGLYVLLSFQGQNLEVFWSRMTWKGVGTERDIAVVSVTLSVEDFSERKLLHIC